MPRHEVGVTPQIGGLAESLVIAVDWLIVQRFPPARDYVCIKSACGLSRPAQIREVAGWQL